MVNSMVLPADQQSFDKFIANEQNIYTRTRKQHQIHFFYKWLCDNYPTVSTIIDVNPVQFREYFQFIEQNIDAGESTKRKYRISLQKFIKWIIKPILAANQNVKFNYDIIFDNEYVEFTDTGFHYDEEPLTAKDVAESLNYFHNRSERDYIMFCLCAFTGMRVSGIVNITFDHINFEERRIETQEKRTKRSTGKNSYPIPKPFLNVFKAYVFQQQQIFPGELRLFPITTKTIREQVKFWRKKMHPHLYRDALNTIWQEMGLDQALRSLLINQKPSGINALHYLKKYRSWKAKLEIYDQYFPFKFDGKGWIPIL